MSRKNTIEDFWLQVNKTDTCWLWAGSTRGRGYGVFSFRGKDFSAHRFSWRITHGNIPNAMHVLHTCDTPKCVNPTHLFLGTNSDNVKDKISKGRHKGWNGAQGENSGPSKLTNKQILEIREKYNTMNYTQDQLAKMYCIHQSVISRIIHRKIWSHI